MKSSRFGSTPIFLGLFLLAGAPFLLAADPGLPKRAAIGIYMLGPQKLIVGTKASYRVSLHWATAPDKTGPLPQALIRVVLGSCSKDVSRLLAWGRTNANGDVNVQFTVPAIKPGDYRLQVSASSSLGRSAQEVSVALIAGGQILLTTDKPLYQPGQTIHVRALALRAIDRQPLAKQEIQWRVVDPRGNQILSKKARTSRFGVASTDLPLATEVNLGTYRIQAAMKNDSVASHVEDVTFRQDTIEAEKTVKVSPYRLPQFSIDIRTNRRSYRPEETINGVLTAQYFFGKPVTKAKAKVELQVRSCTRMSSELRCHEETPQVAELVTDSTGRARFSFTLPRCKGIGVCDEGEIRLEGTVTSQNGAHRSLLVVRPFSQLRVQISSVVPGGSLVQGLPNRVHVLVADLEGRPLPGTPITVRISGKKHSLRSDALGTATVEFTPQAEPSCGVGGQRGMNLTVTADGPSGYRGHLNECMLIKGPELLVRPLTPLVNPGHPLKVELLSSKASSGESGFLDVIRNGQSIASVNAPFQQGRALFSVPTDRSISGLVIVRGYRVLPAGRRITATARTAFIQPPAHLSIKPRLDRSSYRPGEQARIYLHVQDSRTKKGVQAALGLHGVDQALLSLAPTAEDLRLFFSLPAFAAKQTGAMNIHPGRRRLSDWLLDTNSDPRAERAVEILLAATKPGHNDHLETDPWAAREELWEEQVESLVDAARKGVDQLALGIRTSKGWEFHPELVQRLVRGRLAPAKYARDPWQRVVRPENLQAHEPELSFAELAAAAAPEKLERLYTELWRVAKKLKFRRTAFRGIPRSYWPVVIPPNFRVLLRKMPGIKATDVRDPWGFPFRRRRLTNSLLEAYDAGVYSQFEVFSVGPDGTPGTEDDVRPGGETWEVKTPKELAKLLFDLSHHGVGYGVGVGRLGGRRARAPNVVAGRAALRGGFPDTSRRKLTRVRSQFPETLFWCPELITDQQGRATVDVLLPDNITKWMVMANASSLAGTFGTASVNLEVFQPFFIEPDVPQYLTEGDSVQLPVVVRNYTATSQIVRLKIEAQNWFQSKSPLEQQLVLSPAESAVHYFSLQASHAGMHEVTFYAKSLTGTPGFSDAVRRTITVLPNGTEHAIIHSGVIHRAPIQHSLSVPLDAIKGSIHASVAIQPGPASEVLNGLEGMLRMPDGCFEQTSSTLYPNIMILDYLKRTKRANQKIEQRALRYLNVGYQRLLTFEVNGGGFSWFGDAPAKRVLTAYGLQEFVDLSRFITVDRQIIKRTRQWLIGLQREDGSWSHDNGEASPTSSSMDEDTLQVTAYIANAIAYSGYRGKALKKATGFIEQHLISARDPYTLALLANFIATIKDPKLLRSTLERLWKAHRREGQGIVFDNQGNSLTYGSGLSGQIETVALAALAMMRGGFQHEAVTGLMQTLLNKKDRYGTWYSTQATILALKALIEDQQGHATPRGILQVSTDATGRRTLRLDGKRQRAYAVDLSSQISPGSHTVALEFRGSGSLKYQLVGSYWLPHRRDRIVPAQKLTIQTRVDKESVAQGESLNLLVSVTNQGRKKLNMPLVVVPLPPGFEISGEQLELTANRSGATKVQLRNNDAVFYFADLAAAKNINIALPLRSQYALVVQQRPAVVYEYYRPENRAESIPLILRVQ